MKKHIHDKFLQRDFGNFGDACRVEALTGLFVPEVAQNELHRRLVHVADCAAIILAVAVLRSCDIVADESDAFHDVHRRITLRVLAEKQEPCEGELAIPLKAKVAQYLRNIHLAGLEYILDRYAVIELKELAEVVEVDILGTCAVHRHFVGI